MAGFSFRKGSTLRPVLLVAALIVVALVAVHVIEPSELAPTPAVGPVSAIDACHLPTSDVKAGGTYKWQMVVRLDSPQESVIVFDSGSNRLLCEAYRGPDGTFKSTFISIGGHQPRSGAALTYETGSTTAQGETYPTQMVIGQAPVGTASIDVVTTDGEHHYATIANGWYIAWATITGQGQEVVEIDARDSTGKIVARLADPSGLQAGISAVPAS